MTASAYLTDNEKIEGINMETCLLTDFLESIKPWLSQDYIRKAYLDGNDHMVLLFNDNVKNVYRIDDCTREQMVEILKDLKQKGIDVRQ